MFLLMAVILVFVVLSLSNFFKSQSSINSYKQFVSLAGGACTSPQSATNLQFNSPNAIVFQMYDNSTCDPILAANKNTIFSQSYPYSSSLKNNFDLCYVLPGQAISGNNIVSSGRQYYLNSSLSIINEYYLKPIASTYNSKNVVFLPYSDQLSMPALQVTANSADIKDTSIVYYALNASKTATFSPNTYSFDFYIYSNISGSVYLDFINAGNTCQNIQETLSAGYPQHFTISPACNTAFQNVSVVFDTAGKAIQYQINISATQYSGYAGSSDISALSLQCMNLEPAFIGGLLKNQTLVCQPLTCGSTTFQLTNAVNRPFLGLVSGTYSFFEIQSGLSSLQIINNNNEYITKNTLMDLLFANAKQVPGYHNTYMCARFGIDC